MNTEILLQKLRGQREDANKCSSLPRSKLNRLLHPTGNFGYQEAEDYPPGPDDIKEKERGLIDSQRKPKGK